jgi:hypothetical protein
VRWIAAATACAALAACDEGREEVSPRDTRAVSKASADISFYCLNGSFREQIPGHVTRVIAIHDKDPDAILVESSEDQAPMRIVLEQIARSLDGCDAGQARRLRDAAEG